MPHWKSKGCDAPIETSEFNGRSLNEAHQLVGAPVSTDEFVLGEGVTEFRVGLLNLFSLEKDGQRIIREETWTDADCRLTLWSVQNGDIWSVRHGLIWPAEAEF